MFLNFLKINSLNRIRLKHSIYQVLHFFRYVVGHIKLAVLDLVK
jgi:hypothetical protein